MAAGVSLRSRIGPALATVIALACLFAGPARADDLPLKPTRTLAFDTHEGTWMSLDVSPDGKSIVFELLGQIYEMPMTGGRALSVSHGAVFDSQPAYAPDGRHIVFVSDRSGAENVWVARPDGSDARPVTRNDGVDEYVSPSWSADGASIYVSLYRSDRNATELWRYEANGQPRGQELTGGKFSALGAIASPDGRYLIYAAEQGGVPVFQDDVTLPLWSLHRRELRTGRDETIVTNQGSALRPVLSPDGRSLVYAVRRGGQTELRVRHLEGGGDRHLIGPVAHDAQEAVPSRDLLPRYAFTPDGRSIVATIGGKIERIDLATGAAREIPFTAHVERGLGPYLRLALKQETGPVRARLIQDPMWSPDGREIVFSALGRLYLMELATGRTHPLLSTGAPQFMPAWSPDGRTIAYVTWTGVDAGHVWLTPADGATPPRRLSDMAAYYTHPVFTADGEGVLVVRGSQEERMHVFNEPVFTGRAFGDLHQADLVSLPVAGGEAQIVTSGQISGGAQVSDQPGIVTALFDDGLNAVRLDGSGRRSLFQIVGPGYYFLDKPQPVDAMKASPDGRWLLVQHVQQLYLFAMPPAIATPAGGPGGAELPSLDLSAPSVAHRKLTSVGADFFGWTDHGRKITWAVGSRLYSQPLATLRLELPGASSAADPGERPSRGVKGVAEVDAIVEVARDTPHGALLLRGATVITMKGDEVISNADVLVQDDRIVSVGPRGSASIKPGTPVRDVTRKFILPGLIDVHDHWGCVRRGVLDMSNWCFDATLAYGVTAGLDPSALSIDMLAYQDLIDAGLELGPRVFSTGVALFSFNRFTSEREVADVESRYVDDYRTRNLKEYRTGDRRVREWVAMAARDLGLMPTTEGALDMKLDLTQLIDGFPGNEHAMSAAPLYDDVVQLFAKSRTSYTPTLQITHGGPPSMNDFIVRDHPLNDPKIVRFFPEFMRERLFTRAPWVDPQVEYYPAVAAGAARIQRAGGLVGVGSHGNVPGLGYHWELQAYAAGGMTPREVLRAATIGSAETIGRQAELGSLEPGKFADLIILDRDPLADIANTLSVRQVMKNGRLYDADTLDEVWPNPHPAPRAWFRAEEVK